MSRDLKNEIPENPTQAQCIAILLRSYRPEALGIVLGLQRPALGGRSPESLMETASGRRKVYVWALGLADGVMG